MGTENNQTKTLASLGRSFNLGMLYDCREDSTIPGVTLWDLETLRANVQPQPNTQFQIIVSDSIEDKSSALNVSGELKASLLGGMIEVEGSAKYLNDTKKSQQQARVTLQYSTTTRFEQMTMSHLATQKISYPEVLDHDTATHVVTAILYGAQAFFVFDREVSTSERLTDIQGHMEARIRNIPKIGMEGQVSLKMSEEEKANVQKFSCTFYGDYCLPSNPTTFLDAIDIYRSLPQHLGEKGELAVPMKVWLYPLNKLDSRAARLVRGISINLVSRSQAVLEALSQVDIRCCDMIKEFADIPFPEIKQKLQRFKARCEEHRVGFQRSLARVLPSIRGGGEEEGILSDVLMNEEQSPMRSQSLSRWLDNKQKEMSVVRSYLTRMKGIRLVTEAELGGEVMDPMTLFMICFTFTSLDQEDLYLSQIDNYLQCESRGKADQPPADPGHKPWFLSAPSMWECARSFLEFHAANTADVNMKFLVASVPDQDHTGASIYLYQGGTLVSRRFKPPARPPPPSVCSRSHDSVTLNLQPAAPDAGQTVGYRVDYRMAPQGAWDTLITRERSGTCAIPGLSPHKEYQIQYRAVCTPGLSPASDSLSVTTLPTSAPGKPSMAQVKGFDVEVTWEKPSVVGDGVTVQHYKIQYHQTRDIPSAGCDQWQEVRTRGSECVYMLLGLEPSTSYTLRVSAACGQAGESAASHEASLTIASKEKSLAQRYVIDVNLLVEGTPAIYQLPLRAVRCENKGDPVKYRFGKESPKHNVKTIMVLGATGSGKTSIINTMANYILGVEWKDKFRYKLIHEETTRSQAESQTSSVTAYELNHQEGFRIPYSLIIVDTPGFGDIRGGEQDKLITEQITEFFSSPHGVDQIDAVCFVVEAPRPRLTQTQKYMFDSILSIFCKDIAENIRVLVTFADGHVPPVLEIIKQAEIPCPKDRKGQPIHFKFNNSATFAQTGSSGDCDSDYDKSFDQMFWKMGSTNMKRFFAALETMRPHSLWLTKGVLQERKQLDLTVRGLEQQISVSLSKQAEIRKMQEVLEKHKAEVKENINFECEVEVTKAVKRHVDRMVLTCDKCEFTCLDPCSSLSWFHLTSWSGNCRVCPGKCARSDHKVDKYKYDYVTKTAKKTYQDVKAQYEKAWGEKMTQEKLGQKLEEELHQNQFKVQELVGTVTSCLAQLDEIALRPNPLSTLDYINLMIETEKREGKPGFVERIQSLHNVKEQVQLIAKVTKGEPL